MSCVLSCFYGHCALEECCVVGRSLDTRVNCSRTARWMELLLGTGFVLVKVKVTLYYIILYLRPQDFGFPFLSIFAPWTWGKLLKLSERYRHFCGLSSRVLYLNCGDLQITLRAGASEILNFGAISRELFLNS